MEILEQPYITAKDVQKLVPGISKYAARQIVKQVRDEMVSEGAYLIQSREYLVPTKRVKKLLRI